MLVSFAHFPLLFRMSWQQYLNDMIAIRITMRAFLLT